eukprot:CAMPEP_0178757380 /NCGR_PEP_ID=MMETSP0744-20121128/13791_1 /TAXON_ID=913974 /ORGANISM="Nitzschia punctata, Strain CCMP561" /LENGTH=72 /DNA_ID=CAMNT_0020411613 /DNA_START=64 /DNA_END=278 /DNA_ORIENTATION=+
MVKYTLMQFTSYPEYILSCSGKKEGRKLTTDIIREMTILSEISSHALQFSGSTYRSMPSPARLQKSSKSTTT